MFSEFTIRGEEVKEKFWIFKKGDIIHYLTLIENPYYKLNKEGKKRQAGLFQCKCGNIKELSLSEVKNYTVRSCGCYKMEVILKRLQKGTYAKDGLKRCSKCQKEKVVDDFWINRNRPDGLGASCKDCARELAILRKYKLNKISFEDILKNQNFRCAICKIEASKTDIFPLAVDHCHETNRVRGLLCDNCNRLLGAAKDNIKTLQFAIDYLIENPASFLYENK